MTRPTTTGPTQGPWKAVPARTEHGDYYHRITADREVDGVCIATTVSVPNGDREAMEADAADARLIASAPDLLAALRGMIEEFTTGRCYETTNPYLRPCVKVAAAALSRAEGKGGAR